MTTKRTPIRRNAQRRITPEVIEAFRQMEIARQSCTCPPIDWEGEYWKHKECGACDEWWEAHNVLHRALKLPPWQWPAIRYPDAVNPYPTGSFAAKHWQEGQDGVSHLEFALQIEFDNLLDEVARGC